jgi:hypothetical protein
MNYILTLDVGKKKLKMSIEKKIKSDYRSLFKKKDWKIFKLNADKYFESAAKLKKKDFGNTRIILDTLKKKDARLMLRNKRKRLFIGLGSELLIKAFYLKSGFHVNLIPNDKKNGKGSNAFKFSEIPNKDVIPGSTIKFNLLIQGLSELDRKASNKKKGRVDKEIKNALSISKVFRNKEAHISTKGHKYDGKDYDEIEKGIKKMYKSWFDEDLEFQISFEQNEKGKFKIK